MLNSRFCRPDGDISHRMGLWKSLRPIENERFNPILGERLLRLLRCSILWVNMCRILLVLTIFVPLFAPILSAQTPVVKAPDVEALFRSSDPKLQQNKQVVYGIERDLLEANHWELAAKYLTDRYIQHNPNAADGRAAVVKFFTEILKVKPSSIAPKLKGKIVACMAEGDLVTVLSVAEYKDPKNPSSTYTTTWFDTWRIKDGKADEHWDSAMKQ